MKSIYSSPLRVYICLALLAAFGVVSGLSLPVSLFPNSSKPTIHVSVPYGGYSAEEFAKTYGVQLEARLHSLSDAEMRVEKITTTYGSGDASFRVSFGWGVQQKAAQKEVESAVFALSAQFPQEVRDGLSVNSWSENSGFLAISFYSSTRSLDGLYKVLNPIFSPRLAG